MSSVTISRLLLHLHLVGHAVGDLVCTQRKAQFFADRGGGLVSGFGFHSSAHQDWAVANVLRAAGVLQPAGHSRASEGAPSPLVYVDLATNHALHGSNTAFFDRCLGWEGLCVEPNPMYHGKIREVRTCALEPTCVNEDGSEITFKMAGPLGHIALPPSPQNATPAQRVPTKLDSVPHPAKRMRCSRLSTLLQKHRWSHINYLSLDIEGAELSAMRSVDWSATTIDVMTVENAKPDTVAFLARQGMVPALCAHLDLVLVRKGLLPAARRWYEQHGVDAAPMCVHNATDHCIDSQISFLLCHGFWNDEAQWIAASSAGGAGAMTAGKQHPVTPSKEPGKHDGLSRFARKKKAPFRTRPRNPSGYVHATH
jgi:hypothetical protein